MKFNNPKLSNLVLWEEWQIKKNVTHQLFFFNPILFFFKGTHDR